VRRLVLAWQLVRVRVQVQVIRLARVVWVWRSELASRRRLVIAAEVEIPRAQQVSSWARLKCWNQRTVGALQKRRSRRGPHDVPTGPRQACVQLDHP